MEITKELKEKLLEAGSAEEVKALLGDGATDEEAAGLWQEIQKLRESGEVVSLDDAALGAVSGGVKRNPVRIGPVIPAGPKKDI